VPRWLTEASRYEEKKARPEWGREMDMTFAGMLNRGETLKLRDLNAAFQNPKDDLARVLPGVAARRAHRQRLRRRGMRKLLRVYGQGWTRRDPEAALNTDLDEMQVASIRRRAAVRQLRRRWRCPTASTI